MKNWRTIGALLVIVLMALTGCDSPGSGNGEDSVAIEKVFVQGGTFQMGSTDSDADSDESPVHSVTVDSFYMTETEVTFAQYDAYCEDQGITKPNDEGWGRERRPVINVSWYDAAEYSNWLSEQENLTPAYEINGTSVSWNQNGNGYRLPTEWEYAARGGVQTKGYKYAGSNDVGEVGWYNDNSGDKTQPVKGKKANELGLYDMSGNVWEWCWDWYDSDYYSSSPGANPTGPSSGSYRVLRGGSWHYHSRSLRFAFATTTALATAASISGSGWPCLQIEIVLQQGPWGLRPQGPGVEFRLPSAKEG